jgi:3-hydroxybutyryl-CoA dehydrogenase
MSGAINPTYMGKGSNREIEHVGVAGCGIMGTQLVAYFLSRGLKVTLFSRNPVRAETLLHQFMMTRYPNLKTTLNSTQLTICSDIKVLCETQIVIETIQEDLMIKRNFIKRLIETNPLIIIGSCTSSLTLKQITNGLHDCGRVQVIHFSNPVAKMKVIEFVPSRNASDQVKEQLNEFFSQLEHKVIEVPDIPGYVINSIIFAILKKANFLHREYGIPKEDVDALMKQGCGFPMGPFEIEKLIGPQTVELIKKNLADNPSQKRGF